MTRQYSDAVRDGSRISYESVIGTSPKMRLLTGTQPANAAAAETGTLIVEIDLPSDWLSHDGAGVSTKLGVWTEVAAAAGDVGYYRVYDTAVANCHDQGSVTATGGGGDMELNTITAAIGQDILVTAFTITAGNQ